MPTTPERRIRYSAAMSLDGYIADPNGGFDWIPEDPDVDFEALFADLDTVLMGRRSYEAALKMGEDGTRPGMQSFVFSRTLRPEDCPNVTVARDVASTVADLRTKPGKNLWLFGGGDLCRSFLSLGLVDDVQVAIVPVVLGGGLPFVTPGAPRTKLALVRRIDYPKSGMILLDYRVDRG
jgi:dihydrofolate reductase